MVLYAAGILVGCIFNCSSQQAEYHLAGVPWQLPYLSHPFRGNQA
jgi:hypothetical protein